MSTGYASASLSSMHGVSIPRDEWCCILWLAAEVTIINNNTNIINGNCKCALCSVACGYCP